MDVAAPILHCRHVHLFFGNERTEGDSAFKCADGAREFIEKAGIPQAQVHRFRAGSPLVSAAAYEEDLKSLPEEVAGKTAMSTSTAIDETERHVLGALSMLRASLPLVLASAPLT